MDFTLDTDTQDLAAAVRDWGRRSDPTTFWDVEHELGLLGVLGNHEADNRHVNAVVVLEGLARAGVTGPLAETLVARSADVGPDKGPIAIPSGTQRDGRRFVPHGAMASGVLLSVQGRQTMAEPPADGAATIISDGHAWMRLGTDVASFDDLAPALARRAAASLVAGWCQGIVERAAAHARERRQFNKPIGSFQATRFRVVEAFWRTEGLRQLVLEAAWRADQDDPRHDALSALAWVYAYQVGRIVSRHVHQVFGASGFNSEVGLTAVTGAISTQRLSLDRHAAAQTAWEARVRVPHGVQPASTVLGGFAQ